MALAAPSAVPPRSPRWLPFLTGLAAGLAGGLVAVGVAVAVRARRRAGGVAGAGRQRPVSRASEQAPVVYPPPAEAELDEELAQTFPASDPLPYSHRVD
jgi:hypothetical protein